MVGGYTATDTGIWPGPNCHTLTHTVAVPAAKPAGIPVPMSCTICSLCPFLGSSAGNKAASAVEPSLMQLLHHITCRKFSGRDGNRRRIFRTLGNAAACTSYKSFSLLKTHSYQMGFQPVFLFIHSFIVCHHAKVWHCGNLEFHNKSLICPHQQHIFALFYFFTFYILRYSYKLFFHEFK
jgi:hypothetical protein